MIQSKTLPEGIYFLHISFLEESSKGIIKTGITNQLKLLMDLVFHDTNISIQIISCDRTLENISEKKVDFAPAILSSINEKSYYDGALGDDEYALKIASREKISFLPSFFIVSEAKKEELSKKAETLKYKINVLSADDLQ
ncbi:hypothetical protein GOV13_05495 [Candidatus Pacearchaeota archaeon]|nr:hypothetical protein [Candidatus Pacearchaeota archaeon]